MGKRALVVGAGIAGLAAAVGLRRGGWDVVVVERAAGRRTGGYFIGLFPEGREVVAELGLTDRLHVRNPVGAGSWIVRGDGTRVPHPGFLDSPGSPWGLLRGDVEDALFQALDEDTEVRFGTVPAAIEQDDDGVTVRLEQGARAYRQRFDLVVGADGMRSSVRRMVFGPDAAFLHDWHAMICAFQLPGPVPSYGSKDSVRSVRVRRAAWVFGFEDHAPTALLTYRTGDTAAEFAGSRVDRLRTVFQGMDDEVVRHVLDALGTAPEFLFDSVHQVRMPRWSTGRVVLTGDAAWCLNLYSGMGSTAGLLGGARLATALTGDVGTGLADWESGLRPFVTRHQRLAHLKRHIFVPSNRVTAGAFGLAMRLPRRAAAQRAGDGARG